MLQYAHGMVKTIIDIAAFFYIDIAKDQYSNIALFFLIFSSVSLLAFYIFKSLALYKMSRKNGIKVAWLAFIPFANYYLIGRMTGKVRIFGITFSNIGILFGSVLAISFGLSAVIDIYAVSGDFIRLIKYDSYSPDIIVERTKFFQFLNILNFLFSFISYVVLFVMSLSFFAKYDRNKAKLYSIILTISLIFSTYEFFVPVMAVLIFSVRNKEPFDIAAYLRLRNEAIQKIQQQYNQVDPFDEFSNGNSNNGNSGLNQDIFSDFSAPKNYSSSNPTADNIFQNNSTNNQNNKNGDINTNDNKSDDDDLFN